MEPKTKRIKLSEEIFNIVQSAQADNTDRDFPKVRASIQATQRIVRLIQNNYRRRKRA